MRVLYIHGGYFPAFAGAETMARMIAGQMQRRGHTVHLCMGAQQQTLHQSIEDGLAVSVLGSLEPEQVQRVLGWRPDIVHVIDTVDPYFPRAALNMAQHWQTPFVMTPASAIETWQNVADTMAVCRSADLIFVLTKTEAALFQSQGIAAERLMITGQGAYLSETFDPAGFRHQHGINGPLVLFLGRKVHFKGYRMLLEASRQIWSQRDDAVMLFMGPRWDDDCLQVFEAFADPRIVELPTLGEHEKHSALQACDLLCLPTMTDVFPLVLVEAWACGKPVVTTPFPGVEDVVRDGVDGLVAEPSPPALAQAIVTLLNDPARRQALGLAGQRRVTRELNWGTVIDRIEAGYARCQRNEGAE